VEASSVAIEEEICVNSSLLGLPPPFPFGAADPAHRLLDAHLRAVTLDPPNKLSITDLHDGVHVVMSGDTHLDFTAKWDGHEKAVQGNPAFNQIELRRIDKKQAEVKEKKDGALVATVRDKLSADGNELTITTTSAGHADQITVWTRSGGTKVADNLFAGEWTQDLSKTRLRQGIGAQDRGRMEMTGSVFRASSATRPALTARSTISRLRNDTVTLQLVDPHTVDAIYRRDDQVAQKDRWVVSADGQQMTLTTTGTLKNPASASPRSWYFKKQ
jgi:hypothetical protein